jgi:hypothetical protein
MRNAWISYRKIPARDRQWVFERRSSRQTHAGIRQRKRRTAGWQAS